MKKIIALILVLMTVLSMNVVVLGTSAAGEATGEVTLPNGDKMKPGYIDYVNDDKGWISLTEQYVGADGWTAIGTAEAFKKIAVGNKYYLTANIDLTDITTAGILKGSNGSTTTIVLDGCGYTITTNRPLFATLPRNGSVGSEVKNLVVEGTIVTKAADFTSTGWSNNGSSIGAIVGKANGGTFTNIVNNASVTQSDGKGNGDNTTARVGGLIGSVFSAPITIKNCINNGNVTAYSKATTWDYGVAGIVSYIGAVNTTIENVVNTGVITSDNKANTGGIIGTTKTKLISVTNSKNSGAITGGNAGGIIGYTAAEVVINKCDNLATATVIGTSSSGGIIGKYDDYSKVEKALIVENCTNKGAIGSQNNSGAYAGGIIGYTDAMSLIVKSCTNDGAVASANANAGGIIGRAQTGDALTLTYDKTNKEEYVLTWTGDTVGTIDLISCTNNGLITSATEATGSTCAGIIGMQASESESYYKNEADETNKKDYTKVIVGKGTYKNCVNNGAVISASRAAGIIGWADGNADILDCENNNTLTSSNTTTGHAYVGGIVSYASYDTTITGCINTGDLFSTLVAAGILGLNDENGNTIEYCLNTGKITVDETYNDVARASATRNIAAGIIGSSVSTANVNYCGSVGDVMNTSTLTATETTGDGGNSAAGIFGGTSKASTVSNCFAIGTVSNGGATNITAYDLAHSTNITVKDSKYYATSNNTEVAGGYLAYKMTDDTGYWGQEINADATPVLGGEAVKKAEGAEVYYNEFIDATLTLKDDLTLNATANAAVLDESKLTVKFTMNGETVIVDAADVADKYAVKASFADIAPQLIGEDIDIEFYLGETKLFSKTLSIVDYLDALVAQDAATTDVAKALLRYGYEAREFVIEERGGVEADIAEITSDLLSTDALVAPTDVADMSYTKGAAYADDFRIYAAGVRFNNVNKLFFKLYIPEAKAATAKVTINGEEVAFEKDADGYVVFSEDIYAKAFGEQLTVVLYDGANEAYSVTYSIYNYAENMADDAKMGDLALATYYYGAAAAAYAG